MTWDDIRTIHYDSELPAEVIFRVKFNNSADGKINAAVVSKCLYVILEVATAINRELLEEAIDLIENHDTFQYNDVDIEEVKEFLFRELDKYGDLCLEIEEARIGSLDLTISLVAIGLWLLQNTVGETLKQSYLETDLHERLKSLFKLELKSRLPSIKEKTETKLGELEESSPVISSILVNETPQYEIPDDKTKENYLSMDIEVNESECEGRPSSKLD